MAEGTREKHFEDHVVKYLSKIARPEFTEYVEKGNSCYDKGLCLIPEDLLGFIKDTQPKKYEALFNQYGAATDTKLVELVADQVNKSKLKTLQVFREKVKDRGQYLDLVYFKPSHSKTPEHQEGYLKNRFTIIRQLKYSRKNENSIDIVLFVNGLPVVTMELKNALTGQYLHNAVEQYIEDRDPKELLLEFKRCLVHFAVSTEQVSMCTELKGRETFFLPFNKALFNQDDNDYATSYLWKNVLRKDALLDLIQNYVNLQVNKEKYYDTQTKALREKEKPVLIFPRFHQRRAVQNLLEAVRAEGVGKKYLIQHSAGSGKSNTISWLAHRLSDFYQHPDDAKSLFNSVIVVTDRRVLDKQIQDNIRQFEQVPGTVEYIGENKTSQDLKNAIERGKRIIITTLQKFPVISEVVAQNREKTYAVIIDEAHSSQAGESARHLRKALSLEEAETADGLEKDLDDIITDEIKQKGDQNNISFFAFTATPKQKTIELFGTLRNGRREAFDLYTMEQAIKEGFIKDVLKNYVSWKRYYKLIKRTEIEDKEYDKKKTVRVLSSYVDLQDHAIEKKARIMIEHFVSQTQNEIQGKARAMLVTRSRLHAVRFKRKFDDIMREMKLPYSALVAFSGTVTDAETGQDYTKENMNNLGGRIDIPDALKLPQFRILIVANMYQTGFDEPLLHTMFVDKKLGGTSTVQTLSRLNRTTAGKDTTMVLDFVNDPEKVQEDFQAYYGSNYMELNDQTDPNSLYDVQHKVEAFNIIYKNDIEAYARLFFTKGDHKEKLQPILNEVVDRYGAELSDDQKVAFKATIKDFVRLYRFLSQIITFTDVQLEKYYVFLSDLFKKLPANTNALPTEVLEEIDLDSYKLQHQFTTDLALESNSTAMQGMTPGGDGKKEDEENEWLTKIIKVLNETYGLELKDEDKVEFEKMRKNIYENDELMGFFNTRNSKDNIQDKFNDEIDNELLNFINTKLELYNKLSEDKANMMFKRLWFNDIYDQRVRGIQK
ncbi:type I restriction enzyme, R subunit [Dyadobacter koreensis]|uniref:Type I restriction enzyme, R subunit n=1 Tax=Dyadobacter koreensis TaxID=408657 RepID=A0A1H6YRZ5_9BACT|nr:DEAD/DEAH box helicase family protein [Dyadobacter koreensis]SEJ41707.1 type I restriction enzyme, R subunit [Dyadobacter koreensis]